jgi:H+-transporting ATPase
VNRDVEELGQRGIRALAVAKTDDSGKWRFMGLLTFLDPPREDTKETIERCREYKVKVKMITGDHLLIAKETARVLDLGTDISGADQLPMLDPTTKTKPENLGQDYGELCYHSDGFAQVFPEHKFLIVEALRECGFKTGMTGDGVNDAPALKRADVGIAVEGATDAARAAADIVLTKPGLSTIVEGILLSRKIFVRIRNFITYRIAATLQLLVFFFIAVFIFKPIDYQPKHRAEIPGYPDMDYTWPSFFHMPVLMLMLITLLNDGTLIAIGYDNVNARRVPETWNLPLLFLIGAVLAGVALISSLLLLYFCLDSWNPGSFFQIIGIGGLSYGQITTSIYLKVAVSDFLTLFSARASDDWFWTTEPAPILLYAGCFALASSTILACVWPDSYPDEIYTLGLEMRGFSLLPIFIWLYCIAFWFLQDAAKVYVYKFVHEHRLFEDINLTEIEFMTNPGMSSKNAAQYANKMVADDSMAFLSKSVKSGAV